jgi:formylglycine-generating enzyme required for sulfatase activity
MDGPSDLRISNRRELDPSQGYVDVGFRLVTEVKDE